MAEGDQALKINSLASTPIETSSIQGQQQHPVQPF